MERIQLRDHHGTADELGARDLLVLGEDIHHVGGDLVGLVPQHGIDVHVNRRIGADGRHRIADRLKVRTVDAHVAEAFQQTVNRVGGHGQRVGRIGGNQHRQRVGSQRIGRLHQQRIHLHGIAVDQRVDLMQRRGVDRYHLAFAGRTGLTGTELRLGLELAGCKTLLLALLLGQQFGRGLLLPLGGDLFEFLLFGFGRGSFQGGFGFELLLFQVGLPGVADQRVEGIDRRSGQRVDAPQRVGKFGTPQ